MGGFYDSDVLKRLRAEREAEGRRAQEQQDRERKAEQAAQRQIMVSFDASYPLANGTGTQETTFQVPLSAIVRSPMTDGAPVTLAELLRAYESLGNQASNYQVSRI